MWPGISNLDLGVHKTTAVREGTNLEFRAEFFNVLNHTQFFNSDGNTTDGVAFHRLEYIGGHPLLAESALKAVRNWKYESAQKESTETVEVKF